MHLCRGNRGGQWHAEGSYEAVAEKLFNALDIGFFFLEYDSPRAGDFSPLRFVPQDKSIVLGLVSTKMNFLEDKAALKRRIDEASRFVPLERLAVSPQCGFASTELGNPIDAEMQEAKLRLVVELAQEARLVGYGLKVGVRPDGGDDARAEITEPVSRSRLRRVLRLRPTRSSSRSASAGCGIRRSPRSARRPASSPGTASSCRCSTPPAAARRSRR